MAARSKKNENWNQLVSSLKKRLDEEKKRPKKEPLTAVQVVCSQEDIDRTRQGWAKKKKR